MGERLDCLVIGGGPAGLTAAIYLARFHLKICVIDAGDGRCATIPRTHNHAGYPGGIAGAELLERMRAQAGEFGVRLARGTVTLLERDGDDFLARHGQDMTRARSVLLATGVINRRPQMDETEHDTALARGLLRYCPICDGYEATDQRIAVIGTSDHGMREALFLRGYSRDVTLISPHGAHDLDAECRKALDDAGIEAIDGPCGALSIDGDTIAIPLPGGARRFDTAYPALGSDIRSQLGAGIGADCSDVGCLKVDSHQRTSVPGLYAAGDVVLGLDQISNAMGQAGIAATTIRNDLAERAPIRR